MSTTETILFVDDEAAVLAAFQRQFRGSFALETESSVAKALARFERGDPVAVVVADMRMPEMSGAELLAEIRKRSPSTVRIMLTGNSEQATAARAVNEGQIFRFLSKPCSKEDLAAAIQAALDAHRAARLEVELLERTLNGAIRVMTDIVAAMDPSGFERASSRRAAVGVVARALRIEHPWRVELAAMLLDLGVVTVPPDTALKYLRSKPLSPAEWQLTASIPAISARLIAHIPRLESVALMLDGLSRRPHSDDPLESRVLRGCRDYIRALAGGAKPLAAIEAMRAAALAYDSSVLAALECFVARPDHDSAVAVVQNLALADLQPGMTVAATIETKDGQPLMGPGLELTAVTLERIHNHARLKGVREPIQVFDTRPKDRGAPPSYG